jgi:hypothetical protein
MGYQILKIKYQSYILKMKMDSRLHGNDKYGFAFSLFTCFFAGSEKAAPIIGRTCGFDAKIYKIVGWSFAVSACWEGNKKIFKLFYFCSALPSHLVEIITFHSRRLS